MSNTIKWSFDVTTTESAPAAGFVRFNNTAIGSVTEIYVNATDFDGVDRSDLIESWGGNIQFSQVAPGSLAIFAVSTVTDNTGWYTLAVTYLSGDRPTNRAPLEVEAESFALSSGASIAYVDNADAVLQAAIDQLDSDKQDSRDELDFLNTTAANLASGATTDLGSIEGDTVVITGTATITSFGTADVGIMRKCIAGGAFTITHDNNNLIIPGGQNITAALEDSFFALSHGSGAWQVFDYQRRSGLALVSEVDNNLTASTTRAPSKSAVNAVIPTVYEADISGASATNLVNQFSPITFTVANSSAGRFTITANSGTPFTAGKTKVSATLLGTSAQNLSPEIELISTTVIGIRWLDPAVAEADPGEGFSVFIRVYQ